MEALLRAATVDDAAGVHAIYAPVVRDTAISFELEPPTVDEIAGRIRTTLERWPWLVCEARGAAAGGGGERGPSILGYAYAGSHRTRAAYDWCVEAAIYVHPQARRAGVARALYTALFPILRAQGFVNVYAGITLPNPASVGVHEALGFRPLGVYHNIGFKLGRWHDVGWWELALTPHEGPPRPLLPYPRVRDGSDHAAALAAGAALLRPRA
jgi:phosphinothricin acetyltransferase